MDGQAPQADLVNLHKHDADRPQTGHDANGGYHGKSQTDQSGHRATLPRTVVMPDLPTRFHSCFDTVNAAKAAEPADPFS